MLISRQIATLFLILLAPTSAAATWISLGVFSTLERAVVFAEANDADVLMESVEGAVRFRVAAGPFDTRAAARPALTNQRRSHPDAWLIDYAQQPTVASRSAVRAQEPLPVYPDKAPARATVRQDKYTSRADHEDDEAPRGFGMHELRRSEDRRE